MDTVGIRARLEVCHGALVVCNQFTLTTLPVAVDGTVSYVHANVLFAQQCIVPPVVPYDGLEQRGYQNVYPQNRTLSIIRTRGTWKDQCVASGC